MSSWLWGLVGLVGLLAGLALGWFVWGRPLEAQKSREDDFRKAIRDLAVSQKEVEQIGPLRDEVAELRPDREALAALRAQQGERDRQHEERTQQLKQQFETVAAQVLERSHEAFVKRADETFAKHREAATDGLEKNKIALNDLLQPVRDTLTRYENSLKEMETARTGAYEGLKEQILLMREGQERVATEASRLRTTLRSSSGSAGRWGEEQCRNVLERAGLQEGIDFEEQVSSDEHGNRARPDFIVSLPGNRKLVIDVKCSLDAFIGASEAEDEVQRQNFLVEHAKAIKSHAQGLTRKSYQDQFKNSGSFVVMFVPGENFLHAAIQLDRQLLFWGHERNLVIVGPTNLMSLALTVAALRDQQRLAERAEEIAGIGRKLYENLNTLGKNAHATSKAIQSMVNNWNQLVGTLDGSLLSSARKFDELGVGKRSSDVSVLEPLEALIREPQKLLLSSEDAAEAAE